MALAEDKVGILAFVPVLRKLLLDVVGHVGLDDVVDLLELVLQRCREVLLVDIPVFLIVEQIALVIAAITAFQELLAVLRRAVVGLR